MARLPKNWERRLVELAAVHGVTDFLLRGRLTKAESKVFYTILNKLGRPAARATGSTAVRLGGTALSVGRTIAMRHPYITAGAVIYYAVKNREEIADLAKQGWEVVEPVAAPVVDPIIGAGQFAYETAEAAGVYDRPPGFTTGGLGQALGERLGLPTMPKRKKSKFNTAISKAMSAVKNSTKGGKRGVISNPKTTFKTVSKAVSKVNRGAKVSSKGITGIAARAARKVLGKKKRSTKTTKKTKGYSITVN